ncbi:centrosomal protein of 295 kDa isoform X2 [Synchiropus splendidus]|uniref:centrosomal protein of 295 kDa isoform X2 n=1 Tax=Synchiropus splendidus TaxID=270530 RepID=UPI00237E355A|nr:centrosomal protein of 295 kDa isoform X2 [Synchiropus splendidus]
MMKGKVSKLRLSPNEEAQLIREERERRRKLRIQQVREQQRYIAQQIRQNVERKRQRELDLLGEQLRTDWERQQREKLFALQNLYQESLQLVGQGQRSAKENEPDLQAIAQREEENQAKAEARYREALRELHTQKLRDSEKQRRCISARNRALQAEKERAAIVSSLPPPPPPIQVQSVVSKKPLVRRRYDVRAYANTNCHLSTAKVDREEESGQPNAQQGAEQEMRRLQDLHMEEERKRGEQIEMARHRGQEALKKEKHVQDRQRLLVELEHMQQTDLLRRRQQVSLMPAHITQSLYQRHEMKEDFQMDLEFAFNDLHTERRRNADVVHQLLPEPLPPPSPGRLDQELDVTQDDVPMLHEVNWEQEAPKDQPETTSQVDPSRPAHRQALRKLLDRIRNQAHQTVPCASQSSLIPVDELPADQIPEKDTSIETGSISNEERGGPPLGRPTYPPAVIEEDEVSSMADEQIPESVCDSDSRRKRELELEQEKQQQVLLLQELEQQKLMLEQMLSDAQQERDALKADATLETAAARPVPVTQDQGGTQQLEGGQDKVDLLPSLQVEPSAGMDDHSKRVREYQRRMLEQSRVHQRSVEVARQRLQDYQRALQIRYSLSAAPPAPCPEFPEPTQPSASLQAPTREGAAEAQLSLPHSVLPHLGLPPTAAAHRPSTSADVPTRDSPVPALPLDMLDSAMRNLTRPLLDSNQWSADVRQKVAQHLSGRLQPSKTYFPQEVLTTNHLGTSPPHQLLEHTTDDNQASRREAQQMAERMKEQKSLGWKLQEAERLLQQTQQEVERQGQELQELRRQRQLEQEAQRIVDQRRLEEEAKQQLEERKAHHLREVQRAVRRQQLQEPHTVMEQREEEERLRERLQETLELLRQRLQEMESQGRELEEFHRLLEGRRLEALEIQQRRLQLKRQEPEAQETRRVVEQREEEQQQLRHKLLEAQRLLQERQQDMERQGRELQEVRQLMELRSLEEIEAHVQQEERWPQQRIRAEEEQRHQEFEEAQAEALGEAWTPDEEAQVLMELRRGDQEEVKQMAPEVTDDVLASERIHQARLKILGSLLKAIEDSRGGSLSHLEEEVEGEQGEVVQLCTSSERMRPEQERPSPRAAKPPVTRVRLDQMEQHELSAIQEVDSPVNISQVAGQEDAGRSTSLAAVWLEEWSSSLSSDGVLQITSASSQDQQLPGRLSDEFMWRGRRLMGLGSTSGLSDSDSAKRSMSTPSSDSGRGADFSGPAGRTCRSPSELTRPTEGRHSTSPLRPTHSVSSPGVTEDPPADLQISGPASQEQEGSRWGAEWVDVSSLSHSSHISPGARSSLPSVESLFSDHSIQRIIDRYTRELDMSLSSAGKHTDPSSSLLEDPGPSVSQHSFVALTPREAEGGESSSSEQPASSKSGVSSSDLSDFPIPEQHSASEEPSVSADPGQDSFRPLVGQLDLSSSLTVDPQESRLDQLVGQPFAQSSMIGPPVTGSSVLRGWDSTVIRMAGRVTQLATPHTVPQVSEPLTAWLHESTEESVMRPLVWELDESSGPSGSSVNRSGGEASAVSAAPPHPSVPHEVPEHNPAAPSEDLLQEGSFFALLPEVTQNETADASMTFNPLQQEVSCASPAAADSSHSDPPEPERFRAELPGPAGPEPTVELSSLSLSSSNECEVTAFLVQPDLEDRWIDEDAPGEPLAPSGEAEGNMAAAPATQVSLVSSDQLCHFDPSGQKGILEQSEITLASLTDTTLQDSSRSPSEDEEMASKLEDEDPAPGVSQESEGGVRATVGVREEQVQEQPAPPAATLLQFQWGPVDPPDTYQQKRSALIQRSSRRVEDIRARRDQAKTERSPTQRAGSGGHITAGDQTTVQGQKKLLITSTGVCSDHRQVVTEEVKTCDPAQRRRGVVEMKRRTQRLYEQLEEVKVQRAARSRQEESARNRLKAQEFHKKTLVKLRARLPPPP